MKYSDKFFRFPVRLYLTKDVDKKSELEELLGKELSEEIEPLEFVIGWECIDIEDIKGFSSTFSRTRSIEEVKELGFDCTLVYLRYGKEIGCCWSPEKFEKKLDEFCEALSQKTIVKKEKSFWKRIFGGKS